MSKKAVVKKSENNIVVLDDFLKDSGSGVAEIPLDQLSTPIAKITKTGDIENSSTLERYDGKKGVRGRLVHHNFVYLWWLDREDNDLGRPKATFFNYKDCPPHRRDEDNNEYVWLNGEKQKDYIQPTGQTYWILYPEDGGADRVLLPLKKTGLRTYRNMCSRISANANKHKIPTLDKNDPIFEPPIWWYTFNISVVEQKNDSFEWLQFEINYDPQDQFIPKVFDPQSDETWAGIDLQTYRECRDFKQFIEDRDAKIFEAQKQDPNLNGSLWKDVDDEDAPF